MTYLKETYQNKDIDITNINIIEVRKNFLKEQIKKITIQKNRNALQYY